MSPLLPQDNPRKRTIIISVILFLLITLIIAATALDAGITWDEPYYLSFAIKYIGWFSTLSAHSFTKIELINNWWDGQVHPPFGSLYIAFWFRMLYGLFGPMLATRFGAGVLFATATVVVFLWGRKRGSEAAGLCAAFMFASMPRLFAHGHYANLETMTLLLWLATTVAFELGIHNKRWSIACGVLFGLALLTKINGAFLPIFLAPWGLIFHGRKSLRNLICMALIGPAMFLLGWPGLWYEPVKQISAYLKDKTDRIVIPVYYLGRRYNEHFAPWHYPFVMLAVTTPVIVLAAFVNGLVQYARKLRDSWREHSHEALLIWGFLFPVLLLAMPTTPKYDGIRLMLPAYPFLALLAGRGVISAWNWAKGKGWHSAAKTAAAIGFVWLLLPTVAFHPFQLCYYNELVGGPWGATKSGFETSYWCETFDADAREFLNTHVPPNGSIAFIGFDKQGYEYYRLFQYLRRDIRLGDFADRDWEYLVVMPRQGLYGGPELTFLGNHTPVWQNGLPPFNAPTLCRIYQATGD